MGKSRTMGAGLAGSMTKGVNVNQVQFGNKLQGLAPLATHFFIAGNGRAGWNQYRTRADGDKRNFVFCMNQLGGVGASRSQFKIRGLNKPDGTGDCLAGPYSLKDKIEYLRRYGEQEKVSTDLNGCTECPDAAWSPDNYPFLHLTNTVTPEEMADVTAQQRVGLMQAFSNSLVRNMVVYVNSQCSYITGKGCMGNDLGTHTLGLVPNDEIQKLQDCGYGLTKWEELGVYTNKSGKSYKYLTNALKRTDRSVCQDLCSGFGGQDVCEKGYQLSSGVEHPDYICSLKYASGGTQQGNKTYEAPTVGSVGKMCAWNDTNTGDYQDNCSTSTSACTVADTTGNTVSPGNGTFGNCVNRITGTHVNTYG